MKKILAVALSILMMSACFSLCSFAAEPLVTGEFTVLDYNVAGLPDFAALIGKGTKDVPANQRKIASVIEERKYDIVAVQEDFGYHGDLVDNLPSYSYKTMHHGGIPYGDGTSIFTRSFKMYNEAHITWNTLYGVLDDGADQFSQKGITYCCIEIAEGVFVDFYNIHADAFPDEGSVAAKKDNYSQLKALINARKVERPVIVTGDFNEFFFNYPDGNLKTVLYEDLGLKDSWTEICNGGNYDNCREFARTMNGVEKWGYWDSAERFFYKDGGGISLTCEEFAYEFLKNDEGASLSDHAAAYGRFSYTVSDTYTPNTDGLSLGTKDSTFGEYFRRIKVLFQAIVFAFNNFDAIKEYLSAQI